MRYANFGRPQSISVYLLHISKISEENLLFEKLFVSLVGNNFFCSDSFLRDY